MADNDGVGGMDVKKSVLSFAFIAFALLGVLFGMNIMTFIFGTLGPEAAGLTSGSNEYNTSLSIQNNSLGAIDTYASQSTTQFSTLSIAITLVILLAVFAFFWFFFMGSGSSVFGGSKKSKGNFT